MDEFCFLVVDWDGLVSIGVGRAAVLARGDWGILRGGCMTKFMFNEKQHSSMNVLALT